MSTNEYDYRYGTPVCIHQCEMCGKHGEGHYFEGSHSDQPGYEEYLIFICNNCYRENYKSLPKPI